MRNSDFYKMKNKKINPLQELDTSPDSAFVQAVNFVVQAKIPDSYIRKSVPLGVTPLVLQLCDIETIHMRTTYGAIEKVISEFINRPNDDKRYQRIHNIDPEDLKKLPALVCNPIAVIQSQTVAKEPNNRSRKNKHKANGYVILIELLEINKHNNQPMPTIAAIHLSYNKTRQDMELNITSVHGRKTWFIVENLSGNLLMYLNREKCRNLIQQHISPNIKQPLRNSEDKERLEIIAELCGLEYNKGRFLDTGKTTVEARCYSKENDLLFDANNISKTNILQAVNKKISPKQPKRTIPTPTGYKTEEDLMAFREEVKQTAPLTQEVAYQEIMTIYADFVPPDSPAYQETAQKVQQNITERYNKGETINRREITQQREIFAEKFKQARKDYHQAIEKQPAQTSSVEQTQKQDTGNLKR